MMIEIQNTPDGHNDRLETTEEILSELEDR